MGVPYGAPAAAAAANMCCCIPRSMDKTLINPEPRHPNTRATRTNKQTRKGGIAAVRTCAACQA
jgi:hypothetical protein